MKSDWDDAPDYLRSEKKRFPWRVVVIMGVGSALTWGLVALFAKPIVINVDQLKQSIHVGGEPVFSQQTTPQSYSEPQAPASMQSAPFDQPEQRIQKQQPSQADIAWSEQQARLAVERTQNSYNDNNYRPKQPVNTYSAPLPQRVTQAQTSQRTTSRERTSTWIKSWDGGSTYLAEWISINNQIDGSSVCGNHRRGSIDYRECRKGAKQYFKEKCREWASRHRGDQQEASYRMELRHCSAANNFNPLG